MGILEKIKEIEFEINRTQKNKATEFHLGQLKARLAKLRTQLLEPTTKGGSCNLIIIYFPQIYKFIIQPRGLRFHGTGTLGFV